ncbi:MAG: MlaE family lipid ABC transporter permease subunit [Gemmatimonadetes bacterium]|mgnify:CR=1 FL=1|jgi:phospholipid/cholesterol/gamma-HCH transport system permease protein|nr:MlaE family lipid ABC transporter permease subunit [Gemmatimonadota bacterium]MBT6149062.1 MlaE family lipid ABC transporter permease subunit [Gemmatimonadota bacterium]MBT7859895.1 MlaE family lipid ABC transporter permease subunit [Gemmatimonadota bacterium]
MAVRLELSDDVLHVSGPLTVASIGQAQAQLESLLQSSTIRSLRVDLNAVDRLDTGGVVWVERLTRIGLAHNCELAIGDLPTALRTFYESVAPSPPPAMTPVDAVQTDAAEGDSAQPAESFDHRAEDMLDRLGDRAYRDAHAALDFLYVMSDLAWASVAGLFRRRGIRQGSFIEQASIIGADGVGIVALVLFLVGGVSTLQAAAQLRQFGANVLVADLLAIGITRELGPLMTAIMIAGRSGSAFAAEIATMKFTEEIDALRTMALDPLKLVAVPKMWAMLLSLPLLTIMADFVGLLGGTVTGVLSLDISPTTFYSRVANALLLKDIVTGLIKSVSFAWIITTISVYRGLQFRGGASGVGNATTSAVVTSIFAIIVLDLTWGLIFYLR